MVNSSKSATGQTYSRGVAANATPERENYLAPLSGALKTKIGAKEVLTERHVFLSWKCIAQELGGENRGTLSAVANGKREPSAKLIKKLNSAYGCHLHVKTVKANIPVCEFCDEPYTPKHKCKRQPTHTPRRQYDISYKRLRQRIAALPFSVEVRREIEQGLIG